MRNRFYNEDANNYVGLKKNKAMRENLSKRKIRKLKDVMF